MKIKITVEFKNEDSSITVLDINSYRFSDLKEILESERVEKIVINKENVNE